MFILHLPLAVFSFLVKLSSFALVSNVRIILLYSHLSPFCLKRLLVRGELMNLTFTVNAILNLSNFVTYHNVTIDKLNNDTVLGLK